MRTTHPTIQFHILIIQPPATPMTTSNLSCIVQLLRLFLHFIIAPVEVHSCFSHGDGNIISFSNDVSWPEFQTLDKATNTVIPSTEYRVQKPQIKCASLEGKQVDTADSELEIWSSLEVRWMPVLLACGHVRMCTCYWVAVCVQDSQDEFSMTADKNSNIVGKRILYSCGKFLVLGNWNNGKWPCCRMPPLWTRQGKTWLGWVCCRGEVPQCCAQPVE